MYVILYTVVIIILESGTAGNGEWYMADWNSSFPTEKLSGNS